MFTPAPGIRWRHNVLLVACLFACIENSKPPPCPEVGLFQGFIPLFPGTTITPLHATTRGVMDRNTYIGTAPASFRRTHEFHVRCLASESASSEGRARFARPFGSRSWVPGDQVPQVIGKPEDMADMVTLKDGGDTTTEVHISVALPYGRGRSAPPREPTP